MKKSNVSASLRSVKYSSKKILRVSGSIQGLPVAVALSKLKFSKLKISKYIYELIKSAVANGENNNLIDAVKLRIKEINIGRAKYIKRFIPRGRGKSSSIKKHYSNIVVVLESY